MLFHRLTASVFGNFFVVFEGEAVGGAVVGGEVAAARQLGEETAVEGGLLIEVEDFGEEGAYKPAVTLEYRGAL